MDQPSLAVRCRRCCGSVGPCVVLLVVIGVGRHFTSVFLSLRDNQSVDVVCVCVCVGVYIICGLSCVGGARVKLCAPEYLL